MSLSVAECRKVRGNAKGCITRTGTQVSHALTLDHASLDLAHLGRMKDSLTRADDSFQIHHELLHEEHGLMEPPEYLQELDEHTTQVFSMRTRINKLEARCTLAKALSLAEMSLSLLELTAKGGFTSELLTELPETKKLCKDFQTASSNPLLASEPLVVKSRETLSYRVSNIYHLCEPHMLSATRSITPSTTPRPAAPVFNHSALKAVLPKFNGQMLQWKAFWRLFESTIKENSHLTSDQRRVFLVEAMDTPESKQLAREALAYTITYDEAAARLRENYENDVDLHVHHVTQFFKPEVIKNTRVDLRKLLNRLEEHTAGLQAANGFTVEQVMASYASTLLSPSLLSKWKERTGALTKPPSLSTFQTFVKDMIHQSTDPSHISVCDYQAPSSTPESLPRKRLLPKLPNKSALALRRSVECRVCTGDHSVFGCPKLADMSVPARCKWAEDAEVCLNCLSSAHSTSNCTSSNRCKVCQKPHHTLIHSTTDDDASPESVACSVSQQPTKSFFAHSNHSVPVTAHVRVRATGITQMARAHLDTGASVTLMSREFATKLGAHRIPNSGSNVTGVFTSFRTLYQTRITLIGSPKVGRGQQTVAVIAHVVEQIPGPSSQVDMRSVRSLPFLKDLPLADPHYSPGAKIDILLENAAVTACGLRKCKFAQDSNLEARLTLFGWTVGGSHHPPQQQFLPTACFVATIQPPPPPPPNQDDPDHLLHLLWDSVNPPTSPCITSSDNITAVAHFKLTHHRDHTGRYSVSLPRKPNHPRLGSSQAVALRRFLANEKTLKRKGTLQPYQEAVQNYLTLGHAEPVPGEDLVKPEHLSYYLPMHGVSKTSSTSTKLRPVCDASAKSSSGISLNDQLLTGPSLYPRIWSMINQFRSHLIVLTADISKMYRQVGLNEVERDYHRFFHRDEQGVIKPYRMTRLTFGVASSPSLATLVLHQLATDHQQDYPAAADVIRSSFYVDDLLTGSDTLQAAQSIRRDLNCLLDKAGMPLCKWRSNSTALLQSIPPQLREESPLTISPHPEQALKTLGIHWDSRSDSLFVAVPDVSSITTATKRTIASAFARIFDPLGWFGPATMPAKLLLQKSWSLHLDWDTPLPTELQAQWSQWISEIPDIHSHAIPRCLIKSSPSPVQLQLHGFADASMTAFGGVVYSRALKPDTSVVIRLISSRSRLAPTTGQTIPRLELSGALVLAELLSSVATDLSIPPASLFAWTDSAIILGWINQNPANLDTFVGNRVRRICQLIPAANWRYVSTHLNPADVLSRGESPASLCNNPLWWNGPSWLSLQPASWPRRKDINLSRELPPLGPPVVLTTSSDPIELTINSSSFTKLVRIFSWVNRFIQRLRHNHLPPASLQLSIQELRSSEQLLYRHSQHIHYPNELKTLKASQGLPKGNRLRALAPFLDQSGLLRVGGRLQKSLLSESAQHPIILHHRSHTVRLMLQRLHKTMLHAGSSNMMAAVGRSHYIPNVKSYLKSLTHHCVHCLRQSARTSQSLMGQLPSPRVQPSPVFSHVGVDFAGPFSIRRGYTRKPVHVKTYICLFVCLATKAVHIEIASDMTTATFIACLSRFVSRRGRPSHMYSDNGSNFLGAEPHLTDSISKRPSIIPSSSISIWAASQDISWSFSPPRAPHFGGLWEAAIKAMKRHMRSAITDGLLTYEEFSTLTIEVEAILNSRPLIPLDSPSPDSLDVLTPGHFLIGRPLVALPYHHELDQRITLLRRWNLVERLSHTIWQRWKHEYLVILQRRSKWQVDQPPLSPGNIVLVKDNQSFQRDWPLAIITRIFPGSDGRTRVVELRSGTTILRRPIANIVKLLGERQTPLPGGEYVRVPEPPAQAAPPPLPAAL